jgi:class 3 adenylate cyclase
MATCDWAAEAAAVTVTASIVERVRGGRLAPKTRSSPRHGTRTGAAVSDQRIARRVELLLADARAALSGGERAEVDALAKAVLALDPGNAEAGMLVDGSDQRIQMTLLFCDLVGSTELADRLDPEEVSALLREYRLLCTDVIGRFGGFIEDRKGDGLLVRFGYPWVHEDDARRAVLSGLEIIEAIGGHPRGLSVRIAVHTGLVVIDRGEVVGATPNEAARLQTLATPGRLVISDSTQALVHRHFELRPRGEIALRGISRPIAVYDVLGANPGRQPQDASGLTPYTGHVAELELVGARWRRTLVSLAGPHADGGAPGLLVMGPAGIGKSRFVGEAAGRLGARSLVCGCSSFRSTASLHPFVGLLETVCGILPDDDSAQRLVKLRRSLAEHVGDGVGDLPVLGGALSIAAEQTAPPVDVDPTKLRGVALAAAADLVRSAVSTGAVMLVIEDLHWADESSLELIAALLGVPCPGLLVVMTARPGFVAPWGEELVTAIPLAPLPPGDLQVLAERIERSASLDDGRLQNLIARSDGVPLFLEELVRSASALGDDALAGSGLRTTARSRIPAALRDPLLARLVLPGIDLALVQTAATIGREVDRVVLARVTGLEDKPLASKLANLVAAGLVDPGSERTIRFRHDLLRDAAYETQRRSARRERHARIADVLAGDPDLVGVDAGDLAFHLERAERYPQAIDVLLDAARADQALGAHREAIARLTTVLALVQRLPEGPARLLHELGARQLRSFSDITTGGYCGHETASDQARCVAICEQLGLVPELLPSLILSHSYYIFRGDLAAAEGVWRAIERIGTDSELRSATLGICRGLGCFFRGEWRDADALLYAFAADPWVGPPGGPPPGWPLPDDPLGAAWGHVVVTTWMRGDRAGAAAVGERALARVAGLGFPFGPFTTAYIKSLLVVVSRLDGDDVTAARLADEVIELGERHGFELWRLSGQVLRGVSEVRLGDTTGLGALEARVGVLHKLLNAELWVPYWLTELAGAQVAAGEADRARASLDEALAVAAATGAAFYSAETLRLRGLLRCAGGDAGGLADLEAAISTARSQHAAAFEARALDALKRPGAEQLAAS